MKHLFCLFGLVALSLFTLSLSASADDPANTAAMSRDKSTATSVPEGASIASSSEFVIPGPRRSFLRMAGMSQKISPEEVMPLLSRNIVTEGYQGSAQTEFLVLLSRYVVQAKELQALASTNGMTIRVSNCDDAKPLLRILGYRARPNCGQSGASLQTADPERAFLTIDSGFPLLELEQTLQGGPPFDFPYAGFSVPILFTGSDWTMASKKNYMETSNDLVETLLRDPALARLYWAISKTDSETRNILLQSIGVKRLLPYAAVLDFYGSDIHIRSGRVVVPGGIESESAWTELVGTSPGSAPEFVQALLARDKGWLAAYFDALSRASRRQQVYFSQLPRMRRFYDALRTPDHSGKATVGSFRPAPALLLLFTRLKLDPSGEPLVPGNLAVWKDIFRQKSDSGVVRAWGKHTKSFNTPEQLMQALFAVSRAQTETGPLQIFMILSELDCRRPVDRRLLPETVRLLAGKFADYSDQYRIFSEFSELNDESITLFLDLAEMLDKVPSPLRGNALGTFQANVGIWQILARQGEIPSPELNDSWQKLIKPFARVQTAAQLYDAGRASLAELFRATTGHAHGSQDEIIELLAGPQQTSADGKKMHREIASRIRSVLDAQRLVSLDTLLALGDGLHDKAQGKALDDSLIRLAGEVREFEMPRPMFSNGERTEWAAGVYNNRHTETQMHNIVANVLKSPVASPAKIEEARGQLASFLRDSLVGLNYAYYEPPGAQALHNNPLLVRSHDFSAETVSGIKAIWQAPQLFGAGSPAGGGAHFVGSLADLPYALAELEQDFIAPESVQALIWKELTPGLLTSAVLPRWWDVGQNELHAVALFQRTGEEMLAASEKQEDLRSKVMTILSDRLMPQRSEEIELALRNGHVSEILPRMMPADTFYLTAEFQRKYGQLGAWGTAAQELQNLCNQHPQEVRWERLSHDFGIPHPTLAQTYARELLNVAPLPAFAGSASRWLAESWDSSNLYWARLADEAGYSPVALNRLVPELTQHMVERIFATEMEDWTALLRAMHETGEDFRNGKIDLPVSARVGGH